MRRYKTVRGLLADPNRLTKGCYAQDASGSRCQSHDPGAVKFCLVGAIYRIYSPGSEQDQVIDKIAKVIGEKADSPVKVTALVSFGDEATHDQIMAAVRRARI